MAKKEKDLGKITWLIRTKLDGEEKVIPCDRLPQVDTVLELNKRKYQVVKFDLDNFSMELEELHDEPTNGVSK